MPKINYSAKRIEDILKSREKSYIEFVLDTLHTSGSPQAIVANTPIRFTNNAGQVDWFQRPDYITTRWDNVNNKIALPDEIGNPPYLVELGFTFNPGSANDGYLIAKIYIDDASPKLIKTYRYAYSGDTEELNLNLIWFLGDAVGYNAKADGVYFELEFDTNGSIYDKKMIISRL